MRYIIKTPNHGEIKTVKKFLILPVMIDNEIRWLETATIKYKFNFIYEKWEAIGFVNEDKGDNNG